MTVKIGVVTGGGDCPGLNAVIRAVAKAAHRRGWQALGIIGGYEGLLPPQQFKLLEGDILSGLLVRGGTILGTANQGKFGSSESCMRRMGAVTGVDFLRHKLRCPKEFAWKICFCYSDSVRRSGVGLCGDAT